MNIIQIHFAQQVWFELKLRSLKASSGNPACMPLGAHASAQLQPAASSAANESTLLDLSHPGSI